MPKPRSLRILYFMLCISLQLNAQSFIIYGDRTIGSSGNESEVRLHYLGNDKIFLIGISGGDIDGDKTDPKCSITDQSDAWMVFLDTTLTPIWDKSIGGNTIEGNSYPYYGDSLNLIFSVASRSDSSCEKSENSRGHFDYWIYKSDLNGNKIWDRTYGTSVADVSPRITQLSTGDYIIVGATAAAINGDKTVANIGSTDFWVLKLDSLGNKIWDKAYGGTSNESIGSNYPDIIPLDRGQFLFAGMTLSDSGGMISEPTRGVQDIWMIKCDSAGNKIWDKRLGGSGIESLQRILRTPDYGFLISGTTRSPQDGDVSDPTIGNTINSLDCWIIKLDSLGNKQWDKRYGGEGDDASFRIIKDYDSGYLIAATTESPMGFDVSDSSYGSIDYWIFKIDSSGNKIWDLRLGGPGADHALDLILLPDSSIIVAGSASSGISAVKTDSGKGGSDNWLVHFKYIPLTVGINTTLHTDNSLQLYPNPTSDLLHIRINNLESAPLKVDILDILGREVKTVFNGNNLSSILSLETDMNDLSSGVYILQIKQEATLTKKFIKL